MYCNDIHIYYTYYTEVILTYNVYLIQDVKKIKEVKETLPYYELRLDAFIFNPGTIYWD